MKRWIYEPDLFRLFHTKKIIVSILGVILAVIAGNILEMKEQADFLTVDTIMDSFLDGGWYRNFIFVLGAVPFAVSYFEDKSHGFHRQMILRMGLEKYTSSKVKYTALSAFFVSFVGLWGAAGILSLFFKPCYYELYHEVNYSLPYGNVAAEGKTMLFLFYRITLFSLGTAFWAVFALLLSVFKMEKMVIPTLPFIGSFCESRLRFFLPAWLLADACISGENLLPFGILPNFLYGCCYLLLWICIFGVAFYFLVKRSIYGRKNN